MFKGYGDGTVVLPGMHPKTVKTAIAGTAIAAAGIYAVARAVSKRRSSPVETPEGAE